MLSRVDDEKHSDSDSGEDIATKAGDGSRVAVSEFNVVLLRYSIKRAHDNQQFPSTGSP